MSEAVEAGAATRGLELLVVCSRPPGGRGNFGFGAFRGGGPRDGVCGTTVASDDEDEVIVGGEWIGGGESADCSDDVNGGEFVGAATVPFCFIAGAATEVRGRGATGGGCRCPAAGVALAIVASCLMFCLWSLVSVTCAGGL